MTDDLTDRPFATIARAGVFVLLSSSVAYALKFISRVAIARFLGPTDFGEFSTGLAVYSLLALFAGLGVPLAITKLIPEARAKDADSAGLAFTATVAVFLSSVLLCIIAFLFAGVLADFFRVPHAVLLPFIFVVVFDSVLSTVNGISLGYGDPWVRVWLTDVGLAVAYLLLITGFAAIFHTSHAAAVSFFLSVVILSSIGLIYVLRRGYLTISLRPATIPWIIGYSLPFLLISVSGLVFTWSDALVIGHFLGPTAVGEYRAAATLAYVLAFITSAFAVLLLPVASSLYASGRKDVLANVYERSVKWLAVVLAPVAVVLVLFGRGIIYYLFGQSYVGAYSSLVILASLWFFAYVLSVSSRVLLSVNGQRVVSTVYGAAAIANVLLDIILIRMFGISGVAVATGATFLIAHLYLCVYLGRMGLSVDLSRVFFIAALAAAGAIPTFVLFSHMSLVPAVFVGGLLYLALYFALLLSFQVISRDEVRTVFSLIRDSFSGRRGL